MKKLMFLFFFCICVAFHATGEENHYFFQQISPEYGFTHDAIRSLTEDKNGFLWFGSNDGVFYHNTLETKKVELLRDDSTYISYPRIIKTYKDDQDQMWVCSTNGLFIYNSTLNCFSQVKLNLPDLKPVHNTRIDDFLQVGSNKYIVVKNRKCYHYNSGDSVLKALNYGREFSHQAITYLGKDKANIIYGSRRGKVFVARNGITKPELIYESTKRDISSVCRDGNKYYIGFIEGGIEVINLYGEKINEYNEEQSDVNHRIGNRVRQIIKRENGEIWVGAYKGLYIISNDALTHLKFESNIGLPQNSVYALHKGKNGGIWVGTWAGGIAYYSDFNYQFTHVDPISESGSRYQNSVTSFAEDLEGNIWIGSERKGMSLFKTRLDEIDIHKTPVHKASSYGINTVRTLSFLNDETLAVGTFDEGLIHFNTKKEKVEYVIKEINNNMTTAFNSDELWIGGFGFNKVNIPTKENLKLTDFFIKTNKNFKQVSYLFFDSADNLWVCTNAGLYVKFKNSGTFKHCNTRFEGESDNTSIYTCLEDVEGRIWLGTRGKGILIYQPDIDSASQFHINDNITNADIYSLIKDKNDALWFSSNLGIFRYTNEYNEVDQFTEYDGISGRQFNPNAAFLCSNGKLLFGAPNGFNVINPQIIKQNIKRPEVFLAKLLINNKPFSAANSITSNSNNLGLLNALTLEHHPNINIEIISNNFIKPQKNSFKYRLVNYDDTWHEMPTGKDISYTKLPPGKYTFEAFGSNNDHLWSTDPYRLEINIMKPLWKRWYFMIFYLLIILVIILIILKYNDVRNKLKKEIYLERYKNKVNESISAERVKFFLNISHEIRTPLSLILSPIQMLLAKFSYDEKTKELLTIVDRNAQRLVKLTNQTLDYRLLEEGKLKPIFEPTNIIELATNACLYFGQHISEKHIHFSFISDFILLDVNADADMIEKIIFNLMSNAINFTPEHGNITLTIEKKTLTTESYTDVTFVGEEFIGQTIVLSIKDSGKGIKRDNQNSIFERFATGISKEKSGAGIGLHMCKEYAILNKGNIMLYSEEGNGSVFTLNLPLKHEGKYETNKNSNRQIIIHNTANWNEDLDQFLDNKLSESNKRKTILVVEPNTEFRHYLKIFLSKYYNAITAKTVEQALDILINMQPDMIISELQFTGMDGLEFIQKIKTQERFKHIPFIVLTVYTDSKYHLQSIVNGANSFFTKPIGDRLILAEIKKLISATTDHTSNPTSSANSHAVKGLAVEPETFIAIAENVVEENFQNPDFNANTFADILNISQSTLFRKIKKQTNLSCTEFIRDVKLKSAVHLLTNSAMNIDEIALSVGFNSTSYFTRSFRKKYGKTPNEYRKSK